ncbi:uncharacterized protein LOC127814021 [Diospyros lotus]|uniref:uncharacterized protein LOC127814021 n=1 Tax=Diospyros lotus TaxID=55363 RepID=UPI00224F452A|nr:uncharacterized protein LOC127814021 [Diospyros lotus]
MTRLLILFFFLGLIYILFPLVSLGARALFTILSQVVISYLLVLSNVFFLDYSRFQKGYRCYSPQLTRYFVLADVTFFESSSYFPSSSAISDFVSVGLPLLVPSLDLTSPPSPTFSPFPPSFASRLDRFDLQVYQRRPHLVAQPAPTVVASPQEPSPDSSSVPIRSSSFGPSPSTFDLDLPIALRKGWRAAMVEEMSALHSTGT